MKLSLGFFINEQEIFLVYLFPLLIFEKIKKDFIIVFLKNLYISISDLV